jgi:hypothetical protein
VRNPWDRFVSGWHHCESTRGRSLRELLRNLPRHGKDYRHLTRLQRDILINASGHLAIDKLMRFENLQADFDEICDIVRKPRAILPHLNQQVHRPYQEYFTDPIDRDLFCLHFQRDIDTFEYEL